MHAMDLRGLGHLYRNGKGVKRVDLQVEEGEVFGFLGPNGAGKTTLIRTLLGFLSPTTGSATVLGLDIVGDKQEVLSKVGYLASEPALYGALTAYQNLDFAMSIRGAKDYSRMKELAARLDINLNQRYQTLSRGNKQKVAILNAVSHDPDLLILDEPTTGLDPLIQEEVRSLVLDERKRGKTVFMSSHDLAEVEALADRVAIIRDGELVAVDKVDNLRKQRMKYVSFETGRSWSGIASLAGVKDLRQDGRKVRLTYTGEIPALLGALHNCEVVDLSISDPPLEDVFLSFYGHNGAANGRDGAAKGGA